MWESTRGGRVDPGAEREEMMSRLLSILLVMGVALGTTGWIVAQSDGTGVKRPLDLPSGGKGDDEDEEDAPETISFYGGEYEGDGFFWCLDKSGSMDWGNLIGQLKSEMSESLNQLSASPSSAWSPSRAATPCGASSPRMPTPGTSPLRPRG
jgi:hypothetical protein